MGKSSEEKMSRENIFTKEGKRKMMYLFSYIKPYRLQFFLGLFVLFLSRVIMMAFPYLAGLMIDVAQGESNINIDLKSIGLILLGVLVIQGIISYARVMLFAVVSENALANLRSDVYNKLITLRMYFFENNRVGELISRVTGDVEKLYSVLSVTLAEFLGQIVVLVSGIVFLFITTPRLAGIMLLTFPVVIIGAIFFGRYIRKLSKERQAQLADTNNILSESIGAISVVKAFTNELYESQRYRKSVGKMIVISLKYARGRAAFSVFIITLLFGALFFIIWQAAMMVASGAITAGELISFVSYTALIGGSIASLGSFYTELVGALGATERVREILDEEQELEINEGKRYTNLKAQELSFQDVSFAYPSQPDRDVIKHLNLDVKVGERIALVGASGAGKSTIMQLILRYFNPQKGQILLGNKDVGDMDLSEYRSYFGIVPQDVILFAGSVRENIAYGNPNASLEEIKKAADLAFAREFIEMSPDGYETIIGERGMKLSGGQRQRIAIARAILKDPKILLLDEATSALDAESEQKVQMALDNLMKNRTSIVIAHRLATVVSCDKIYVMEDGEIVEVGTHHELVENEEGVYHHLASLQFDNPVEIKT